MRSTNKLFLAVAIAGAALVSADAVNAQNPPAHMHIGHVADGFRDTPEGGGLLPTAIAEAQVVVQHATFMANSTTNLNQMRNHAGHVIHAIDPTVIENGPGLGYGLKRAAEGTISHIELAAGSDGASQAVRTHSVHIATATRNALERAEQILVLAGRIQQAESPEQAAALVEELKGLADRLLPGPGWQEGQGGLEISLQHVGLLKQAEGLP